MREAELKYYDKIGNWDFSKIKCKIEKLSNWDFFEKIKENTDEQSLCLDLGTGGGEKVLEKYPDVGMIIATDFSNEMIKTAKMNLKNYQDKKVKFVYMDNLKMNFPKATFDLISARHTVIDVNQIYNCLTEEGTLIIEGIDKKDCWEIKELFGRGQSYNDKISIAEKEYLNLKKAGFTRIEKVEILENEYYEKEADLMGLLLKTPIINNFFELKNKNFEHKPVIEKELFDEYVKTHSTVKGILLKRVLYGFVVKK